MQWRFIPFQTYDPYVKTALNQVALEYAEREGQGVLWFSAWSTPAVNIGYGQRVEDVVNTEEAKKRGVVIVRRQGGGGAVFLGEGELSWSMAAPTKIFPEERIKAYEEVTSTLIRALEDIGVEAWHKPVNDVMTEKGKISGGTLKKQGKTTYMGATVLYEVDKAVMRAVLKDDPEKEYDDPASRVTAISELTGTTFGDFLTVFEDRVLAQKTYVVSDWTEKELERAQELVEMYKSEEWVYQR